MSTVVAGAAADRVLQHSEVLEVAEKQAREPEFRCLAVRANHGGTTIRALRRDVHSPTEGLLPVLQFRCTLGILARTPRFTGSNHGLGRVFYLRRLRQEERRL
jgi:hypothetical protein